MIKVKKRLQTFHQFPVVKNIKKNFTNPSFTMETKVSLDFHRTEIFSQKIIKVSTLFIHINIKMSYFIPHFTFSTEFIHARSKILNFPATFGYFYQRKLSLYVETARDDEWETIPCDQTFNRCADLVKLILFWFQGTPGVVYNSKYENIFGSTHNSCQLHKLNEKSATKSYSSDKRLSDY